jgi:hypothetical protein
MTNFTPDEHLEAIRQEHEPFLTKLEALAVQAIATNNWDSFYQHLIDFQNEHDLHGETGIAIAQNLTVKFLKLEASTDSLRRSGADFSPKPTKRLRTNSNHVTTTRINAETTGSDGLSQRAGDNAAHP